MNKQAEEAIKVFKKGGIVIFPTDTAFGIGCRIDNEKAVFRLFEIRKRPRNKAVPVLFDSIDMVRKYVEEIPQDVEDLMKKYWPGALTIILKSRKGAISNLVLGGGETVGVRIPNHPTILKIIERVGVPILGPSANFSGQKTAYSFEDLDRQLVSLVSFVVKGETKDLKMASTVIDCSKKPWTVLRKGAIPLSF